MARANIVDDHEDKPLDPAVEKVRRKLVRFVAINLGLLFVALMAVVAALVYKTGFSGPDGGGQEAGGDMSLVPAPADASLIEGDIALPAGARLVAQSLYGNRIALTVELPGGDNAILLYDIAERRIIGRFTVTAQ